MLKNTLLNLKTGIRRFLMGKLNLHRPTSAPYITGDSFRALAQHVYDECVDIEPACIMRGDIVFVRTNYLHDFFTLKHPHIDQPYILISHNEDMVVDDKYLHYIDDKIIHWFAENALVVHKKITPIPIGIQNFYGYSHGKIADLEKIRNNKSVKDKKILSGFRIESNPEIRNKAFDSAKRCSLVEFVNETDVYKYFEKVSKATHILSPEGRGPDCLKTWEALYLGTVPIVKKLPFTDFFAKAGVPLILINDWNDISDFNKANLEKNTPQVLNHPMLWMNYWAALISEKRSEVFKE